MEEINNMPTNNEDNQLLWQIYNATNDYFNSVQNKADKKEIIDKINSLYNFYESDKVTYYTIKTNILKDYTLLKTTQEVINIIQNDVKNDPNLNSAPEKTRKLLTEISNKIDKLIEKELQYQASIIDQFFSNIKSPEDMFVSLKALHDDNNDTHAKIICGILEFNISNISEIKKEEIKQLLLLVPTECAKLQSLINKSKQNPSEKSNKLIENIKAIGHILKIIFEKIKLNKKNAELNTNAAKLQNKKFDKIVSFTKRNKNQMNLKDVQQNLIKKTEDIKNTIQVVIENANNILYNEEKIPITIPKKQGDNFLKELEKINKISGIDQKESNELIKDIKNYYKISLIKENQTYLVGNNHRLNISPEADVKISPTADVKISPTADEIKKQINKIASEAATALIKAENQKPTGFFSRW